LVDSKLTCLFITKRLGMFPGLYESALDVLQSLAKTEMVLTVLIDNSHEMVTPAARRDAVNYAI